MADRQCTLIDNQPHCVKNPKFLIFNLIEHLFTQVLPIPKPRGLNLDDAIKVLPFCLSIRLDLTCLLQYRSERAARRREAKRAKVSYWMDA